MLLVTWIGEHSSWGLRKSSGKDLKKSPVVKEKDFFPPPGIEPGPAGWEPAILTTRPWRTWCRRTWKGHILALTAGLRTSRHRKYFQADIEPILFGKGWNSNTDLGYCLLQIYDNLSSCDLLGPEWPWLRFPYPEGWYVCLSRLDSQTNMDSRQRNVAISYATCRKRVL